MTTVAVARPLGRQPLFQISGPKYTEGAEGVMEASTAKRREYTHVLVFFVQLCLDFFNCDQEVS